MRILFLLLTLVISLNSVAQKFSANLIHEEVLNTEENVYVTYANFDKDDNIILGFDNRHGDYPLSSFKILKGNNFSVIQNYTFEGEIISKMYSSKNGGFLFFSNNLFGGGEFIFEKRNNEYAYKETLYLSNPIGYYHIKIRDVTFSSNEEYIAIGGWVRPGGAFEIYKTSNLEEPVFYVQDLTNALAFSPDNKYIVAGGPIGFYSVYAVENNFEKVSKSLDCGCSVSSMTFSPNAHFFANILTNEEENNSVAIHSFADGEITLLQTPSLNNWNDQPSKISFSPDGNFFIVTASSMLYIYSVKNNFKLVKKVDTKIDIENFSVNISGSKIMVTDDRILKLYKIAN